MNRLLIVLLAAAPLFAEQLSYEDAKRDVNAYISQTTDEQLFLDPVLEQELSELTDRIIVDAGRSTGIWGVPEKREAPLCSLACVEGDVTSLPFDNESIARLLSLNIGSELPSTIYLNQEDTRGLAMHCEELARVMKRGGRMLIVAPASFDQVFTDGTLGLDDLNAKIERILGKIGASKEPDHIIKQLEQLTEVNRATFVHRDGRLVLVKDTSQLQLGEQIWRKEPNGVKLSYFHNDEEYLVAINQVGLFCEEIRRPCFFGRVKHRIYNAGLPSGQKGLGDSYIEHNPFTIFTVVKPV
ncbi:MAG: hypothetical protein S4CHLAM81_11220 [Chlamydiales bacterium]|nr:hypothetical protein [Chlamydiales bacterium]MCH9635900.1 hypothetical protein [Chlamydiales bacterium]MCH9703881.1 hypothetical protein [Chlamydiota bacterium]